MKENRPVLIGLALVFLVLIITYYLYSVERHRQEELRASERLRLDVESSALESQNLEELEVVLYFCEPGVMVPTVDGLVPEKRSIFQTNDSVLTARQIINELIKGPSEEGVRVFPEHARLRQIYLLGDGTAVVDFSRDTAYQLGGVTAELGMIYSVTRSLTQNIPEVRGVKFLVDGRESHSLAGHISIIEPFMYNVSDVNAKRRPAGRRSEAGDDHTQLQ